MKDYHLYQIVRDFHIWDILTIDLFYFFLCVPTLYV